MSEVLHGWHNAYTQSCVSFLAFLQNQSGFTPPQHIVPLKEEVIYLGQFKNKSDVINCVFYVPIDFSGVVSQSLSKSLFSKAMMLCVGSGL